MVDNDSPPLVSVLITMYNREDFISDCIESVVKSTYLHWEAIIVDDCSTDQSVDIARRWAEKDHRIRVYQNATNLGDYANRNKSASYARGKYLKYIDADDMIYPHGLEFFVTEMERHPEAGLAIAQEVAEDNDPYPFLLTPHQAYVREFINRGVLGVGPTGTMIRRDVFELLGGFVEGRHIGDTDLWLRMAMFYPVLKVNGCLTFWRKHQGQEIVAERKNSLVVGVRFRHLVSMLSLKDCPLSQVERELALNIVKRKFLRYVLSLAFRHHRWKEAYNLISYSRLSLIDLRHAFSNK